MVCLIWFVKIILYGIIWLINAIYSPETHFDFLYKRHGKSDLHM